MGIRAKSDCSQSFWHAVITVEDRWLSCAIKVLNLVHLFSMNLYQTMSAVITPHKKIKTTHVYESCITVQTLCSHLSPFADSNDVVLLMTFQGKRILYCQRWKGTKYKYFVHVPK